MIRQGCDFPIEHIRATFQKILDAKVSELSGFLADFKTILDHCEGSLSIPPPKIRTGLGVDGCSCIIRRNRRK